MSERDDDRSETFLTRWSRVKSGAREASAAPAAPVAPARVEEEKAPELPPVEELTLDSDFRGFFHPRVDEDVRRKALRKLFSDPHFNVMDGLDVYIDDYSKTEPIPAAMLASLQQAQRIFAWAAEKEEEPVSDGSVDIAAAPQLTPIEAQSEEAVPVSVPDPAGVPKQST
ncbi:MAG TPA: DUF3306 domain-containing protein [Burkholderiales bacterium]|nr:DUF3306 domain-containing protein [Burkholderiales bacterium]